MTAARHEKVPASPTVRTVGRLLRAAGQASSAGLASQRLVPVPQGVVIPGYTGGMKTAISLPDDTYEQATRQAAELGISRSEFFARAARRYLDDLAEESLTQQIDEALESAGSDDSLATAVTAGRARVASEDDW